MGLEGIEKEYNLDLSVTQPKDGNDSGDDYQELQIKTSNCGGGPYYILSTERWAFDDPKELFDLINEFIKKYEAISKSKSK